MLILTAEDRQRIAFSWTLSIGITVLILTTLFFIKLTRTTPPVAPLELFVEVNYGNDAVGSGNIQTFNKPSPAKVVEETKPETETKEIKAVPPPKPVEQPKPTPKEEVNEPEPDPKPAEKPVISSNTESPVEEKPKEEPKKTVEAPKPTVQEAPKETKPAPKPVNEDALFSKSKGGNAGSNGSAGPQKGEGGNNNGDDAEGVGDKGAKEGSLYAKSYKGGGGGGGTNVGLNLSGWSWSRKPTIDDNSDVTGEIIFKIVVNKNGQVKNVITQSTTVTDYAVINQYKSAVRSLTFIPKSANVPDESTGTITFIISAK